MKIDRGNKVMLDTNVLVEATDQGRALHARAQALIRDAWNSGVDLFVSTQTLREYLVVATRPPEKNGLGLELKLALENIAKFRLRAAVLPESIRAGEIFLELAGRHNITGIRLHDLQILATAEAGGMSALITANDKDFPKNQRISVIPLAKAVV